MEYIVRPKEYHRGYCPTICESLESAEEELSLMRKYTDFEWDIVEELDEDEEELQCIEDEKPVDLYMREYEQMIEAMECPDIVFYEDTPEDVRLVIESINCMLNRNSHKLSEPILMDVSRKVYKDGKQDRVEEVVYHEGKLWAQEYLKEYDCWERRCLEAYEKSALEKLLNAIINDLF